MNSLKFEGKGFAFFKIHFINVILTVLSLTFLYPWAKVRELKYLFSNTYLAGNHFTFSGTTATFFKGYIRTFLAILFVYLLCFTGGYLSNVYKDSVFSFAIYILTVTIGICLLYYLIPIILHGSLNYRLDNTAWGDTRPSYTGKLSELTSLYFANAFLTTLTAGIYTAWFEVKLNKYILQHLRFGQPPV